MVNTTTLTIAVASDLHCHAQGPNGQEDSYLLAGARRIPEGKHPVQSLLSLIRAKKLTAMAVVCPGDLANQICSSGMMQAWEHLREIRRELGADHLITTLGNHDVDSRKKYGSNAFEIPRTLHPEFPHSGDVEKDSFWNRGFYFVPIPQSRAVFVVLNTVLGHTDEATAKRGMFDFAHIQGLRAALERSEGTLYDWDSGAIRIAVLHHHPALHSTVDYTSDDVLELGDQLLMTLADHGYRFIIHGHRHDPRISRLQLNGIEQIVFASGAFSAYLKKLSSRTRNLFHIITLALSASDEIRGCIRSWEYNWGHGWSEATTRSAALPHYSGLSMPAASIDVSTLCAACKDAPGGQLRAAEIHSQFPQIEFMLPGEIEALGKALLLRNHKLVTSSTGKVERCGRISGT